MGLPFVKKTAIGLLTANYPTDEEAAAKSLLVSAYYQSSYPAVASQRAEDIQAAGRTLLAIYRRNVFPDLKVTWGTYPNNLGHMTILAASAATMTATSRPIKKTIPQDCGTCHQSLAIEEASPEILKTMGIADQLSKFEKK